MDGQDETLKTLTQQTHPCSVSVKKHIKNGRLSYIDPRPRPTSGIRAIEGLCTSNHEDASDTGVAPKQQQHVIPQTTAISNIKLSILKKEDMIYCYGRMEHYLDTIDNDVWKDIVRRFQEWMIHKRDLEYYQNSQFKNGRKVYDRFQELLSQLEAHGAEVSTEDANHKFLRSLPLAWSNLAMTMRTKPDVDTLSIDDLYNNLRQSSIISKSFFTAPSTSSTNIPEKEVLAGFADEVIYSLFSKQLEDWDLLHEDLEQIDDLDIEEMDINWQIAMIAIRMKKFYKKTRRRVRVDGKTPVANRTHDGKKKRDSFYQHQEAGKQEKNQMGLLTMDDGIVNWGEHTKVEETNHALMAISSSSEVSLCSKTCIDLYNTLNTLCDEQMNQLGDQEAQILAYSQAVKKLEAQLKTLYSWKDSSKNLWRLINSGMSSSSKIGLGYEIKSNDEVLSYEEEMNFSVFNCTEEDSVGKPLYSRFIKTNDFKGVPHPLSGDYTPTPQEEIDESLYVYGKKGPQEPEPNVSDDRSSECSTCQSNDSAGSIGTSSVHSVDFESEISRVPQEVYVSKPITTNEKGVSAPKSKEVEPSCVTHIKTPRQPIKDQETPKVNRKNWNAMMERELGEGYSFTKKKCFVCGSLSHLIKDCDYYEKKMAREAEFKKQRVFNTGNGVAKPVWTNANRVNHANQFVLMKPRESSSSSTVWQDGGGFGESEEDRGWGGSGVVLCGYTPQSAHVVGVLCVGLVFCLGGWGVVLVAVVEHPLKNMVDRGIFDSGCSGHMTGNKDQLEDFEEFNGGSVTFGGSKGYISGIAWMCR
ncbi:hypothetical protein Tco_0093564 [Tanacetum coccineum]